MKKISFSQCLAITFIPAGYVIFQPVIYKSSISGVENILAFSGIAMVFWILFCPLFVKHKLLKKLNWVGALSDKQLKALQTNNWKEYNQNSHGFTKRVTPYFLRISLIITAIYIVDSLLFPVQNHTINIQKYLQLIPLTLAFYLTGVLLFIALHVGMSLNKKQ
ncbi:hypothetical protein ABTC85_15685 [Acinetobacter baumannii]|uniref:Uncharacterized protein n=3 Tax=Acinetobacter baumannii TaxID=470 RepID=A0A0C4Y9A5_ACIBA|nr:MULTISPECIES: hypothetical protein [Acinetobacter calcoaceticus/baumannii complex]AFI97432.1 hypothetical protein ABTJ_p0054 [Acinetobacter baumannii MDR-TJ]AGQ12326.1 hypothetical protein BJAB0868_p0069 [Acinetobacter baumannii BJAB0868]AGQ16187.1 hypothetical protein BJAB07104_p0059 [Acinetobacter baumannii BJAB07104]AJF79902.1 hypothetical protein NG19_0066 [Acinetobacter baumannii]APF45690.1 hypothetical protein BKJ37_19270 [Acinetobacter baumannii]